MVTIEPDGCAYNALVIFANALEANPFAVAPRRAAPPIRHFRFFISHFSFCISPFSCAAFSIGGT
ncbi:MAG: hypothetical protein ABSG04_01085 [Verrucomicrobiota bacterium]|jgi:hypothetical protein